MLSKRTVLDESGLIQKARSGDLEAFNQLVIACQDAVYRQARWMMGEPEAAEDLTQEAFILAYQKLHLFNGGSFRYWLMRIVTHLCIDELRRRKRRPTIPLVQTDSNGEEIESASWMIDPGENIEDAYERSDLQRILQKCLAELPKDYRMIIALIDIQEMNYAQAATILGVPLGTVKSRLARARARLQELLVAAGVRPQPSKPAAASAQLPTQPFLVEKAPVASAPLGSRYTGKGC